MSTSLLAYAKMRVLVYVCTETSPGFSKEYTPACPAEAGILGPTPRGRTCKPLNPEPLTSNP